MMPVLTAWHLNQAAADSRIAEPLSIKRESFDGALTWIDKMTDPDTGRIGYIQTRGPSRPTAGADR